MSLLFLLLKFFKVWECPYDYWLFLVLVDLDIIAFCRLSYYLRRRNRGW